MNKAELVRRVTPRMRKQKYTEGTVSLFVELVLQEVRDALLRGEAVTLRGFGSFAPVRRKARVGRVLTGGAAMGAPVAIPPKVAVRFAPSAWVDDVLMPDPAPHEGKRKGRSAHEGNGPA